MFNTKTPAAPAPEAETAQPAPETAEPAAPEQSAAEQLAELVKRCQAEVCPGCTVKTEADDTRLRALAEMDNFKKRLQREKDEQIKYAAEKVLADLLPVLDNLELALQYGGKDEVCKNLLTGVEMTRKIFLDTLKQHGLIPVGVVGEAFDPEVHEAVAQEPRADMEAGCVATLHQRGYRLKERLLRPAKVSVSQKA